MEWDEIDSAARVGMKMDGWMEWDEIDSAARVGMTMDGWNGMR